MKKRYEVVLFGCWDSTEFRADLTDDEVALLRKIARKSADAARVQRRQSRAVAAGVDMSLPTCHPVMQVRKPR